MVIRVIAILAAAFLFTGCGKKTEAPSPAAQPVIQPAPVQNDTNTAASAQNSQTAEPGAGWRGGPRPTPVVAPGTNANEAPDLTAMSFAVRAWVSSRHHWPENFEEWAAAPNYSYPPPPAGKKYAFDRKYHVILVNR